MKMQGGDFDEFLMSFLQESITGDQKMQYTCGSILTHFLWKKTSYC